MDFYEKLISFLFPIQWDKFQIFASENSENVQFDRKLKEEWIHLSRTFQ
mgnify:CR=1 FL=1